MKTNVKAERRDGQNLWRQSAVGLLLLTLLVANPLQGFSQGVGVITNSSTIGTNLYLGFGPLTNIVTVVSNINNNTSGNDAVLGTNHFWSLTNAATLNGHLNGVNLQAGGSVNNLTGATNTGGQNGVYITNGIGSVVNAGSITGTNNNGVYMTANTTNGSVNNLTGGIITGGNDGVSLGAGGSVNNQTNGIISGGWNGVEIDGATGSVTNAGSIRGTNNIGVFLTVGGSVNNLTNGIIQGGNYGVSITGGTGYVTNTGSITGTTNDGVYLGAGGSVNNLTNGIITGGNNGAEIFGGGTVDNELGGTITGHTNGVFITGTGYVTNAGTITGTNNNGVYMTAGGGVNNLTNGTITGGANGVEIDGATGSVVNAGTITGTNHDGVYMTVGGSVNNLTNGTITGGRDGVEIEGAAGYVTNTGTIRGTNYAGVYLGVGGSVNNLTNGIITGGGYGVALTGNTGSVINAGSITGTTNDGVYIGDGGGVNNLTNGTITGGNNGVFFDSGGTGSVVNAGSITGTTNDGVYMGAGGSVSNLAGGFILGNINGVEITNGIGSVVNVGTIRGTNWNGVYMDANTTNGSVNNLTNGTITGGANGVFITGTGYVTNAGTITGTGADGVFIGSGGSVNNLTNGIITGGYMGVGIYGATGSVVNAGVIIGTNNNGVYMTAGGSVNNLTNGIITGGANGVELAAGSVVNAGTITGMNGSGVALDIGGSVNNLTNGIISGGWDGVEIAGAAGSVVNAGSIRGTNGSGVALGTGGSVSNLSGGIISGNVAGVAIVGGGSVNNLLGGFILGNGYGVVITNGQGSMVNAGTIKGTNFDGVFMSTNGSVNNLVSGMIIGGTNGAGNGLEIAGTGSVVNAGSIETLGPSTGNDGIHMTGGGSVDNQLNGFIGGHNNGVSITGGAAFVTNAGTIDGISGTAIGLGNYSNTVVLQTGSDVEGNIVGGTSFDAAILQGDGSYSSNFVNFETLTVQADTNGWNLTGTNTFSTNAIVQTGLLSINGSLTTPFLTVSNGAVLGGVGTINGIVNDHGIISPGNSIGTLDIVGGLNMTNAIYNEQVNAAGQSDLIHVSGSPGTAIISNASVVVLPAQQVYSVQTIYTNLTATGGVLGTNAGVSISTPAFSFPSWLGFAASLQYPNTNTVTTTLTRNAFVSVANTYNQHSAAGALDGIGIVGLSPTMSNLVSNFFWLSSAAAAQAALDSLSGEIHGSLGMLDVQQQNAFNNSIALRTGRISAGGQSGGYASAKPLQLASASPTPLPAQSGADQVLDNIWLQGFGTFGHLDGDGNASGGNFTISGFNGGFDYHLLPECPECPQMLVGLAVGYSHDDATVGGPGASGKVDAFQLGGYGGYVAGPWHLDGIFSYGFLKTDTKRFIDVGSIHQEADGSYDGGVFSLSTEGGYVFKFDQITIEPTVGLNYAHLSQDGFNETGTASDGNNYGLNVNSVDMDSLRSVLGVRLAAQFGEKDGVQFIPALRAGWEHEFMDKTADMNARFIGGSGDFTVHGVELGADSGVLGAGLTVTFNKAIQGFVNYDASLNKRMSSQGVSGGLSYSW